MHSSLPTETSVLNDNKARKSKRASVPTEHFTRQSVRDPKIIKQLIKSSEKHEIHKLIQELKEEEIPEIRNGSHIAIKTEEIPKIKMETEEEKSLQPKIHVPADFQEKFRSDYRSFLELYRETSLQKNAGLKLHEGEFYRNEQNILVLAKLYYLCEENYYEANALQLWKDLPKCFTEEDLEIMNNNPKEFYKKHLFYFDRFSKTDKAKESLLETLKLEADYLSDPYIKYAPQSGEFSMTPDFIEEVAQHQCALLKGFVNVLGIDPHLFSIPSIVKSYPEVIIDVVTQNPNLYGFIQDTKKTYQYKKKMTLHEYSNYQKESSIRMPQQVKDKNGMIQFAVNIDFDGWKEHMQELITKVPPEWLFDSKKDAMRVVNQKIRGVNLPQFFLKVEGAWTGGHEENLRLRAVNFNHGPDSCVWYTIGTESSKDFRAFVKNHYDLDIHKDEGLWFGDIDLCIKNKIKIQYFIQEPGDIVLLGPGCLHWVRCLGITMNSAWNICSQDKLQFEKAFEREKINREINFKSIIPIKHISLNLFTQDFESLPGDLQRYLAQKLIDLFDEELVLYANFMRKYPAAIFTQEDKASSVYNCTVCNYETLNFYTYCDSCSKQKKPKRIAVLTCLNCYDGHLKECKSEGSQIYFYYKLSPEIVKNLQQILQNVESKSPEITAIFKNFDKYFDEIGIGESKNKLDTNGSKEQNTNVQETNKIESNSRNDSRSPHEKMEEQKLAEKSREEDFTLKHQSEEQNHSIQMEASHGQNEIDKSEIEEMFGKRKRSDSEDEDSELDKNYTIKKKTKPNPIYVDQPENDNLQEDGRDDVHHGQDPAKDSVHAHHNFFINKLSEQ